MAKITLNPLTGSYGSVVALNNLFQLIEDALNDDVLWRNNPPTEDNAMKHDFDMSNYNILNSNVFNSSDLYMGPFAAAPTTLADGTPLSTATIGRIYYNTTDYTTYLWSGTAWGNIATAGTAASSITVSDTGGYYTGGFVEDVLQEIGATDAADRLVNVTLTGTQTLTNKTMTAPVLDDAQTQNGGRVHGLVLFDTPVLPRLENRTNTSSLINLDISAHTGTDVAKIAILHAEISIDVDDILGNYATTRMRAAKTGVVLTDLHTVAMVSDLHELTGGAPRSISANSVRAFVNLDTGEAFDYDITITGVGTPQAGLQALYLAGYYT